MNRENQILEQFGTLSKGFEMLVKLFGLTIEKCGSYKINYMKGPIEKKNKKLV
ncbi:MAG: hypothetical protein JEZ09_10425 [Salinivirgaceae bacterium]|nr:hypothetical protein [Salinivirgaceae bacterium]